MTDEDVHELEGVACPLGHREMLDDEAEARGEHVVDRLQREASEKIESHGASASLRGLNHQHLILRRQRPRRPFGPGYDRAVDRDRDPLALRQAELRQQRAQVRARRQGMRLVVDADRGGGSVHGLASR